MAHRSPWTPEQQAAITEIERNMAVVGKIAAMVFEHFAKVAHDSQQRLEALGKVLLAKQYVAAREWESALQEVELGERAEYALDPDYQAAIRKLQQMARDAGAGGRVMAEADYPVIAGAQAA